MPENYIAMFPVPDKDEARRIIAKADPRIQQVAQAIVAGKRLLLEKINCTTDY